jgi:tRNA A37 threonylcarbamoyladenosine synthetase subunit TsaC/SUA5/YrdC
VRFDLADPATASSVADVLRSGAAVVLPNPSPLTYVVAATSPEAVNQAKRRPPEQDVAVWALDEQVWAQIAEVSDLPQPDREPARRLLREARVTMLVPLRPQATVPAWLAPAIRDDHALLFGTLWPPLQPVLESFPYLYVSSANRTGHPPAATATEATAMFGDQAVLDGDSARDATASHAATSMVRITAGGGLELVRSGATDHVVTAARSAL